MKIRAHDHPVVGIVSGLKEETDYNKTRNYWKYLKAKLKKQNYQLGSGTTQLKLTAADGKKYNSDMLESIGVIELESNRADSCASSQ